MRAFAHDVIAEHAHQGGMGGQPQFGTDGGAGAKTFGIRHMQIEGIELDRALALHPVRQFAEAVLRHGDHMRSDPQRCLDGPAFPEVERQCATSIAELASDGAAQPRSMVMSLVCTMSSPSRAIAARAWPNMRS